MTSTPSHFNNLNLKDKKPVYQKTDLPSDTRSEQTMVNFYEDTNLSFDSIDHATEEAIRFVNDLA